MSDWFRVHWFWYFSHSQYLFRGFVEEKVVARNSSNGGNARSTADKLSKISRLNFFKLTVNFLHAQEHNMLTFFHHWSLINFEEGWESDEVTTKLEKSQVPE